MNIKIEKELQHGYYIISKPKVSEFILVRMKIDAQGNVYKYIEYDSSKFKYKLMKCYEKELKTNKTLIMKVEETLVNLTIPELKSLLPSYYQLVIQRRIKELQDKENAITKTNRVTKTTTKTSNRKRNI